MANKFNLDRKKRKLKRLSMRRNFDTVFLDNGKVKEYCGERTNALIIYKHKSKQFVNLIGKAGNERIFNSRTYYGEPDTGRSNMSFGVTDT